MKLGTPNLKNNISNTVTFLILFLMSVCLILRDVNGMAINKFFFVALFFACCLFNTKTDIYKIVAYLTPLAVGLPYTYIIVIAEVFVLVKNKLRFKVDPIPFFCIALIIFLELLSLYRGYFDIIAFIGFSAIMMFSFGRMVDNSTDYDNEGIVNYYIAGFFVAALDLIGQILTQFSFSQLLNMGTLLERFGNTNQLLDLAEQSMRLSYNPNSLGCICIQVFLIALIMIRRDKKYVFYGVAIAVSLSMGIMTQSRVFVLTLVIMLLMFIIFTKKNIKTIVRGSLELIAFSFVAYLFLTKYLASYIEGFRARINVVDITNGRSMLFKMYNNELAHHFDRLLWGVGLNQYPEKYGFDQCSHNAIQEVIVAWGLIGLVIVVILFSIILLKAYRRVGSKNFVFFLPFIATIVMVQTGQGFRDEVNLLRLIVMYSTIMIAYNQETEKSCSEAAMLPLGDK